MQQFRYFARTLLTETTTRKSHPVSDLQSPPAGRHGLEESDLEAHRGIFSESGYLLALDGPESYLGL